MSAPLVHALHPDFATVYLDIETTGLDAQEDEVVQIGVVDEQGEPLLEALVRPVRHREWPEAQAIHGITPAAVALAPSLQQVLPALLELVRGKRLVAFNAGFDCSFLPGVREAAAEVRCCMEEFSEYYYTRHQDPEQIGRSTIRWVSLATAAAYALHGNERPHAALPDALACRAVWRFLHDPIEHERIEAAREVSRIEAQVWQDLHTEAALAREAQDCFRKRMTLFWLRWLRLSVLTDEPQHARRRREEEYAWLFYGVPLAALILEERNGRALPVYHAASEVPASLKRATQLAQEPAWLRARLVPDACRVSGRRFAWLYDQAQVAALWAAHPLRRPYTPRPGYVLMTRAQLRRSGYRAAQIRALLPNPVSEVFYRSSRKWCPLFEVPVSCAPPTESGASARRNQVHPNP